MVRDTEFPANRFLKVVTLLHEVFGREVPLLALFRPGEHALHLVEEDVPVADEPRALAGAAAYVGGMTLGFNPSLVTLGSALLALVLRGCAIQFKWSLPAIKLGE